jgi:colanic acid biosynthesis glycosyl transferase WcaI
MSNLLLLSQAYPPDPTATGQYLSQLAEHLCQNGHNVTVLSGECGYEARQKPMPLNYSTGNLVIQRLKTSQTRSSTSMIFRVLRQLGFIVQIFFAGIRVPRADVIFFVTTPPLIGLSVWLLAKFRKIPAVLWWMDINPDQAVLAGFLKPNDWKVLLFTKYNHILLQSMSNVILLDHYMERRVKKAYAVSGSHIISLWPLIQHNSKNISPKNFLKNHGLLGKIVIMYSGNHSLVHPLDTLLEAIEDYEDRQDISFVFVGNGPGKSFVTKWKHKHTLVPVKQLPYQPMENIDESLGAADLHVVSMGSDMPGCVHPSKAYTVLAMGKPLLYLGPKESAIGQWIKDNHIGWQIDHGDVDRLRQILEIFLGMSRTERLEQSKKVLKFAENYLDRNKKLNEIQNVIESCLK